MRALRAATCHAASRCAGGSCLLAILPLALLIARWPLESAAQRCNSPSYPQQASLVPALPDQLHSNGQALPILPIRQNDGGMASVVEQGSMGADLPVHLLLL